jgi:hypothetical protein
MAHREKKLTYGEVWALKMKLDGNLENMCVVAHEINEC